MDGAWIHGQLVGCGCAVCGGSYRPEAVHLLARRGELAFVALDCAACASQSVMIVALDAAPPPGPGERPSDPVTLPAGPLEARDVARMRTFLRSFDGDFQRHFGRSAEPDAGARR